MLVTCDLFRLNLLNRFGGIYVDADSLPAGEFGDEIMASRRFCVCRRYSGGVFPDNYFMGQAEGASEWTDPMDPSSAMQLFDDCKRDTAFTRRKTMFVNCQLDFGKCALPIEHYMVRSWEAFGGKAVWKLDFTDDTKSK